MRHIIQILTGRSIFKQSFSSTFHYEQFQTDIICIYGNLQLNTLMQLIYTNKKEIFLTQKVETSVINSHVYRFYCYQLIIYLILSRLSLIIFLPILLIIFKPNFQESCYFICKYLYQHVSLKYSLLKYNHIIVTCKKY